MTSSRSDVPDRYSVRPGASLTANSCCSFPRRVSASTRIVRSPASAHDSARLTARNDFPSCGDGLEIATDRGLPVVLRRCMRTDLIDSTSWEASSADPALTPPLTRRTIRAASSSTSSSVGGRTTPPVAPPSPRRSRRRRRRAAVHGDGGTPTRPRRTRAAPRRPAPCRRASGSDGPLTGA
jgi:hypothetical protein